MILHYILGLTNIIPYSFYGLGAVSIKKALIPITSQATAIKTSIIEISVIQIYWYYPILLVFQKRRNLCFNCALALPYLLNSSKADIASAAYM